MLLLQRRTSIQSLIRSRAVFPINGSLRDELLNEEIFDSLGDARRLLALWRYDYNTVKPHSSLANQTPQQARRTLEPYEGNRPI